MSIRVLTVEDSGLIRMIINRTIEEMDGVELVGTAENGEVALEKVAALKPDILTLDLVMPVMDGLDTLKKLRETSDIPVIILSAKNDEETTIEALENGAQDFLKKPESIAKNHQQFKENLESRIKALANNDKIKAELKKPTNKKRLKATKNADAVMIGASTGGPKMLTTLIKQLPQTMSIPIFIVQHMPEGFTTSFAKRLNTLAEVPVVEAGNGMPIEKGTVYIAPGGKHMVLKGNEIKLLDTAKINHVKPAIDPLFESAIEKYGGNLLAVLMTGMGRDGAQGCLKVKQAGGHVIAQDEASSVVYGMPKCAVEADAVHEVLSIDEIIKEIYGQAKG